MKLESAKERVKDLIRISEEGAFRYPDDSKLFLNDKEALSLVLSKLEEYEECLEVVSKELGNVAYDQLPIAIAEIKAKNVNINCDKRR